MEYKATAVSDSVSDEATTSLSDSAHLEAHSLCKDAHTRDVYLAGTRFWLVSTAYVELISNWMCMAG